MGERAARTRRPACRRAQHRARSGRSPCGGRARESNRLALAGQERRRPGFFLRPLKRGFQPLRQRAAGTGSGRGRARLHPHRPHSRALHCGIGRVEKPQRGLHPVFSFRPRADPRAHGDWRCAGAGHHAHALPEKDRAHPEPVARTAACAVGARSRARKTQSRARSTSPGWWARRVSNSASRPPIPRSRRCCISPAAPPARPRARCMCTRPWSPIMRRANWCSTCIPKTFSGAPPTPAG